LEPWDPKKKEVYLKKNFPPRVIFYPKKTPKNGFVDMVLRAPKNPPGLILGLSGAKPLWE